MVVFYATEIWGDLLYTQNNTIKCLFEKKKILLFYAQKFTKVCIYGPPKRY